MNVYLFSLCLVFLLSREETVIVLVQLGATPGAVEDPTSAFPRGQTAADLGSSRGHKGIAGYLAEADLTNQLSVLTVKENETGNIATTIAANSALQSVEDDSSSMTTDEQHYLKESLAVFQKSAHAAASILAAFRARSFCQRQLAKSSSDISEVLDVVADSLSKVQNKGHFEDYLHFAALKIQKRYRGWKGRKDFLKIRDRIVKIQVHVCLQCIPLPSNYDHTRLLEDFHDKFNHQLLFCFTLK